MLSIVDCTSNNQVRTLRPPTALLVTVTWGGLNSGWKWPHQPRGQGALPFATAESPAIHTATFASGYI